MQLIIVMGCSLGDHLPVLQIAREAARRGHQVVALGCEKFLSSLDGTNIDVRPTSSAAEYEEMCRQVASSPPRALLKVFRDIAAAELPRLYDAIRSIDSFEETGILVPKFPVGIGARLIAETYALPLMEYQLEPSPIYSGWLGWEKRLITPAYNFAINRILGLGPVVNAFRRKLGTPPLRNLSRWAYEQPQAICGMYPEWIGRARRFDNSDRRFLFAGFPTSDSPEDEKLPSVAEEFLSAGSPPILVSQTSWSHQDVRFERETQAALESLGARAIFAGMSDETVVTPSLLKIPFLPYRLVLPRTAAFIHHGGAGTIAMSLAAGIPQLIVPRLQGQSDLGVRLRNLGVGRIVRPWMYRAPRVAKTLLELIHSQEVTDRCREFAERMRQGGADGANVACDVMERLIRREQPHMPSAGDFGSTANPAQSLVQSAAVR